MGINTGVGRSRMARRGMIVAAALAALAGTSTPVAGQAPTASSGPGVTREAFTTLSWLEGRWKGSGGGYDAFFEEYRILDGTTIQQRTFPDSTFATPDGVSTIEWSADGAFKRRGGTTEAVVAWISGDTVRFEPRSPGRQGFTWLRVSGDEWRAVLEGRNGTVVYTLVRFGR
jgi:hypothetical protein